MARINDDLVVQMPADDMVVFALSDGCEFTITMGEAQRIIAVLHYFLQCAGVESGR